MCRAHRTIRCGKVVKGIADCNCKPYEERVMKLEPDRINSFLGTEISLDEMVRILNSPALKLIQII